MNADAMMNRLLHSVSRVFDSYATVHGGRCKQVLLTSSFAPAFGAARGATPEGNRSGAPLPTRPGKLLDTSVKALMIGLVLGVASSVAGTAGFAAAAIPADAVNMAVDQAPSRDSLETMQARQRQAAWRKRRIIMNNDGGDCLLPTKPVEPRTVENFLAQRTSPLVGSQVDTLFYCDGVFNRYSHHSRETELLKGGDFGAENWAHELFQIAGRDALQIIADFGHAQGWEVFWSMRMNDTHDSDDGSLLGEWKKSHPGLLMGVKGNTLRYGGNRWSGVNYDQDEVREKVYRIIMDVATRYDVDGIELDFFRHPLYFREMMLGEPVTQAQCDKMTGLLARVRQGTQEVARRRGRPFLIAVRVMDSPGFARGIGLDVEAWLKQGLVDVLVAGGCYFHLEPWKTMVNMGHKYDVPVYACLSASRLPENDEKVWRGEALDAWQAGADGIYTFNLIDPRHRLFRELGDPALLKTLPADHRYIMGSPYWIDFLKDGGKYRRISN
jgi:hypothetical protein